MVADECTYTRQVPPYFDRRTVAHRVHAGMRHLAPDGFDMPAPYLLDRIVPGGAGFLDCLHSGSKHPARLTLRHQLVPRVWFGVVAKCEYMLLPF